MTREQEARALWPKPAVGQRWADADLDAIVITEVRDEGDYRVSFKWDTGESGACEYDMRGFEPTFETWAAHLLAEREKLDGARAALAKVASRGVLVDWGFARGSLKTVQWKCAACDALFRRAGICDKPECSSVIAAAALPATPPTSAATTEKETP